MKNIMVKSCYIAVYPQKISSLVLFTLMFGFYVRYRLTNCMI